MNFSVKSRIFAIIISTLIIATPVSGQYQFDYQYLSADTEENENYRDFEGKPILIDAFATWCEPCKTEILHIKEVHNNVGDEIKVLTISVSTDGGPDDNLQGIRQFRDNYEANWEFGLDVNKVLTELYGVTTLPSLLLFDGNGTLVQFWEGITQVETIYNTLDREFEITGELDPESPGEADFLLERLLENTAFRVTLGITILLTIFIIITNLVNKPDQ